MHVFVTIPLDQGGTAPAQVVRGLIADLFGPRRPPWPGGHYAVRTWDRADGGDLLQVSLASDTASADEARDRAGEAARAHGLRPTAAEVPLEEVPSPLWNSGVAGPGFDAASKRLCAAVAPALARAASELVHETGKAGAYRLALRLMAANAGAAVLESEQRHLTSRDFGELVSLRLLSYRSHYEGAKNARATDPDAFERRCAGFYEALGAYARDLVRDCAASPVPAAGDEPARTWVEAVRGRFGPLRDLCRDGLIAHEGPTLDAYGGGGGARPPASAFHADLSEAMSELLHRNPDFMAYRIQTSLLYSCLHTLGFTLAERYLFCYILARANEEVAGRGAEELAQGLDAVAREVAAG